MSPQEKGLDKLCPCIRGKIEKLIENFLILKSGPLQVIETLRQKDRQEHYISIGVSWTLDSKHLPQPPKGLSLACDLAPKAILKLKNWAPKSPLWEQMGLGGQLLRMIWGGTWKQKDLTHFELKKCECP